jgi:hypothetical protein
MLNNFKFYVVLCLFIAAMVCYSVQRVQLKRLRAQLSAFTTQQETARALYVNQLNELTKKQEAAKASHNKISQQMGSITHTAVSNYCNKAMQYARDYADEFKRSY